MWFASCLRWSPVVWLVLLPICGALQAAEEEARSAPAGNKVVVELDPYYSNVGLYLPLTEQAIPELGRARELAIYRHLLLNSFRPRFMVLEASGNPLPAAGALLRSRQPDLYQNAMIGGVNVIEAMSAGFDEPAALSLFLGNVVNYGDRASLEGASNMGYMGYLLTGGSKHIKGNRFIDDNWLEMELKMKSDQHFSEHKLSFSYRLGTKLHSNPDITDVVYLGLRRSHLDTRQSSRLYDFITNGDLEYTITLENGSYQLVQQELRVGKKWPLQQWGKAFTLDIGLVWYTNRKYSGALADNQERTFTFMLRPNLEF